MQTEARLHGSGVRSSAEAPGGLGRDHIRGIDMASWTLWGAVFRAPTAAARLQSVR